jgi:hypothetical protein
MSDEMAWEHGLHSVPCGGDVPDPGGSPARDPVAGRSWEELDPAERRLIDVVAVLAGEPWTEWPSRVHPALVAVAHGVHEHSSRVGREALLPMAPTLVDTARRGLETSARVVATCVSTALASPGPERITDEEHERLCLAHETARYLLARGSQGRVPAGRLGEAGQADDADARARAAWWVRLPGATLLVEPVYRRFAAPDAAALAVAVAARARATDRDLRLRRLLRWCVAQATADAGPATGDATGPPTEPPTGLPARGPMRGDDTGGLR